ncbi:MAG: thioredoxin domain-containing protein [Pseudomonadota bacterium]
MPRLRRTLVWASGLLPWIALACATTPESASPTPATLSAPRPLQLPADPERRAVELGEAPCRGAVDARVTVVEFSDFECSHCARAQETLYTLEQQHPGELRVCFKHRPLPLHFFARDAAEAAVAAQRQGRFWPFHDKAFAHQHALGAEDLQQHARHAGVDVERFDRDRLSDDVLAAVDRDEEQAVALGVKGTPTFFFNGHRVVGMRPFEDFEQAFSLALRDADLALAAGVSRPLVYQALQQAMHQGQSADPGRTRVVGGVTVAGEDPCRGPLDAPVTLVAFTDFECPYCGMAKQTVDALEDRYPKRLRVCLMMNPLPFHTHATSAARWALAAHLQGRFFDLHDDLFAHQDALDDASVLGRAASLGLDVERLRRDAAGPEVGAMLARHQEQARAAGLRGTPSFVINDEVIFGAKPLAVFEDAVERALTARP